MYKILEKDLVLFYKEHTHVKPGTKAYMGHLMKYRDQLEPVILFWKMCNVASKVTQEKIRKYQTTPESCQCVYNQVSSEKQFGFKMCKHTFAEYLATQDGETISDYLEHLFVYYNMKRDRESSNKIMELLQTIIRLTELGAVHGLYQLKVIEEEKWSIKFGE